MMVAAQYAKLNQRNKPMGKSGPRNCGNVNMKGKKYKLLSCRCCECQDFREKMLNKTITKEMSEDSYKNYDMFEDPEFDYCDWMFERELWNEYKTRG